MEKGVYAEAFVICQKYLNNKIGKENTKKYNFQGQSSISIHWFYLDHDGLEENLSAREPDLYKKTLSNKY